MKYIALAMQWNTVLNNKQLDFDVTQLAAVYVDESAHTIATFYRLNSKYCKDARKLAYMMNMEDDVIMDMDTAWNEFRDWLPKEEVVFLVWIPQTERVVHTCNRKYGKKSMRMKVVNLQSLCEVMLPDLSHPITLGKNMKTLELTCENAHMESALYQAQCLVRLYRKLWKEAMKYINEDEWNRLLIEGETDVLKELGLFPHIVGKQQLSEGRSTIQCFCREQNFTCRIRGTLVKIDTFQAMWTFDILKKGTDLAYVPKRYVQLPHLDMQLPSSEKSIAEILTEIQERITRTEERLGHGMGSAEVEELVRGISNELVSVVDKFI